MKLEEKVMSPRSVQASKMLPQTDKTERYFELNTTDLLFQFNLYHFQPEESPALLMLSYCDKCHVIISTIVEHQQSNFVLM